MKRPIVVYIAGNRWEDIRGTDHRLVEALAKTISVLWVEPPMPVFGVAGQWRVRRPSGCDLVQIGAQLTSVTTTVPPGFTRPVSRTIGRRLQAAGVRSGLKRMGVSPIAVVNASASTYFPAGVAGRRLLYMTDDWVAGAEMMGLSPRVLARTLRLNMQKADTVLAVSPHLASGMRLNSCRNIEVLPNGCTLHGAPTVQLVRRPVAGLIGQLNERIDLDLLEAVSTAGTPVEVIGPRRDRDPRRVDRWNAFLARPNVTWVGELSEKELPARLAALGVGLTPYADNEFNRASFPLKTLEYLAAGLPVVSTDLPAVRWLDTSLIEVGIGRLDFVQRVQRLLTAAPDPRMEQDRRRFAHSHSWDARVHRLLSLAQAGAS